jgi:hypothetical protein
MKNYLAEGRLMTALRFWSVLIVLASAAITVPTGCRKPGGSTSDISAQVKISPQPVRVGDATIVIQLADAAVKPVTHATIAVEADMSHPGMSPAFATAQESQPGIYTAHLDFNMAGDWVVLLHIKLADGRAIERQIDVRGVGSN